MLRSKIIIIIFISALSVVACRKNPLEVDNIGEPTSTINDNIPADGNVITDEKYIISYNIKDVSPKSVYLYIENAMNCQFVTKRDNKKYISSSIGTAVIPAIKGKQDTVFVYFTGTDESVQEITYSTVRSLQ